MKYDASFYDIFISETDNIERITAGRKYVIGKGNKSKIRYIDELDIESIMQKTDTNDIKFSIIVPNYNNAEWISKTIESVINQTYKNWEMYIIDDMSTDNSIEVIKKYKDDI